ncbi:hypothetical protein ABPG75_013440 [Micractinium tetrahymenae]
MSGGDRVKQLFKKYGKIAIGVHFTVYFSFLAGCYVAIDNHVDVKGPLQKIGLLSKDSVDEAAAAEAAAGEPGAAQQQQQQQQQQAEKGWLDRVLSGGSSTLALAFICNKALFPVRTPITLGLTPVVARVLRHRAAATKVPAP